jgi:hypothetical protein
VIIPFAVYNNKYNNLTYSYIPTLSNHLEQTKLYEVCGSKKIFRRLRKAHIYVQLELFEDDHYLMYSKDGNLTNNGYDIIETIIKFINKL